jgi:hypothetical protein
MAEVSTEIELAKGVPKIVQLGSLTMTLKPGDLVAGSSFTASPVKLVCTPTIAGGSPRTWEYTILPKFDGFCFSADVRQESTSLQNKNLASPVIGLKDNEEIMVTIPSSPVSLSATLEKPTASVEILGRFTWVDQR